MKVGILTFHCAHNYGAVLQCLALQSFIKSLGFNVEVINYKPQYLLKSYRPFTRHRITFRTPFKIPYQLFLEFRYNICRWVKFQKFISQYLNLSIPVKNRLIPNKYDIYILGSDQIWSEHITNGDTIYLCDFPFDKENKKYISYSASIETENPSYSFECSLQKFIPQFDCISVRELSQVNYIKQFTKEPVFCTLDPTLLVEYDFWNKIAKEPVKVKPYVLLYQVRMDERARERAKNITQQLKLELVEILAEPTFGVQPDYCIKEASPDEFVGWFKKAEFIITSSFHGTVFSLIFQKDFYTLKLGDGKDGRSYNLLSKVGLETRMMDLSSQTFRIEPVDYTQSEIAIKELRNESVEYLCHSLISK